MANDPKQPSLQAGLRFEKAQKLAREGEKARAEYDAAGRAADVNRARLKALRLAKEAADRDAEPPPAPAAKKSTASKKKR